MILRHLILTAGLAALGLSAAPAFADVKAGVDAWSAGDYERAVAEWREPALAGDADAQFNLGQAYRLGRGVPMNSEVALEWFRNAMAQRAGGVIHYKAADEYGLTLFQAGRRQEALPYIEASASRGEPRAQYVLGTALFNGKLVEKDWVRAYAMMSQASAAGIPAATRSLQQMDLYITADDRQKATGLAASMASAAAHGRAEQTAGFPVSTAQAETVADPVDVPASTASGTNYAPPVVASAPAAAPEPAPAPSPAPVRQAPPVRAAASSDSIPGYTPSVPARGPVATATAPVAAAPTVAAPAPATPAPVAATGDWRVQLGAFGSQDQARAQWNGLEGKVSVLAGLQPYLVNAGKVTRLQAGPFATKAAADKVCAAVKSSGNACFAVRK